MLRYFFVINNYIFLHLLYKLIKVQKTTFIELVNDGLMTFFFLLIGLEMKFHLVEGEHKNKKTNITCSGSPWRCGNSNIHVF
ncbi:hypothetical protein MC1_07495 [Rickettsia parkeri str. Portsmouth]|nr:hypothetical protein MC1_07495 [Rickettsia parkeri str. Portsmouth]